MIQRGDPLLTKSVDNNPWDSAKQVVVNILAKAANTTTEIVTNSIEVPPESSWNISSLQKMPTWSSYAVAGTTEGMGM